MVGTHALIQGDVAFADLAVVVVDEQHRFGVVQRDEMGRRAAAGGSTPHALYMTATPIPRTLALTFYGDLDVTVIAGAPAGRAPVDTRLSPRVIAPSVMSSCASSSTRVVRPTSSVR